MKLPRSDTRAPTLPPAVFFDMDDTIFDHSLTCRAALVALDRSNGFLGDRSPDEAWREYGRLLGETHTEVMLGRRTSEDARAERFERLARWAGRPVDRAEAEEYSRVYREEYQRRRRPVPGAPELVRRLHRRTTIAIVTNNTMAEQTEKLGFLGLTGAVDHLITSEEVGVAKPDPGIFRAAARRARVAPTDALMVGDSWESDVLGAESVGIRAVWFNRFRLARPPGPRSQEFSSFRPTGRIERVLAAAFGHRPPG